MMTLAARSLPRVVTRDSERDPIDDTRPARRIVFLLWFVVIALLTGCAYAPGGHIDESQLEESLDSRVNVEPITPELVSGMQAGMQNEEVSGARLPPESLMRELQSYEYLLGPGDIVSVIVYDHPELTIPAGSERTAAETGNRVRPDGTMFYPYVGRIQVEGMTLEELRGVLTNRLAEVITDPQVEVGIAAFRSQKVYVSGAVEQPGAQPLTIVPTTVLDAISNAGGARADADWHRVILTRDGREERLSLFAMLQQGDLTQNRLLRNGDLLHVPGAENQNVVVLGHVLKPGTIPLGNERLSLTDALARAGGVNESRAQPSGIFVVRGNPPESEKLATVYQLDISDATRLMLGTRFPLQPQDVVYVTAAPLARWNNVISLLLPSVTLPGDVASSTNEIGEL